MKNETQRMTLLKDSEATFLAFLVVNSLIEEKEHDLLAEIIIEEQVEKLFKKVEELKVKEMTVEENNQLVKILFQKLLFTLDIL